VQPGTAADQIAEDGDGAVVAERGEAVEAERVEVVAGEQGEVGVVAGEQARLAVVEQVALVDRLDDQGVLAGVGSGAGAIGREQAEGRWCRGVDHVDRDRRLLLDQLGRELMQSVPSGFVVPLGRHA
jgi:hypothetical protein